MKTSPKIHKGPRGAGTSKAVNPLMHWAETPSPTLRTYWFGARSNTLPPIVNETVGICDRLLQSTADSPFGLGSFSQSWFT
uniref:Uncharacterized protein MANES_13G068000 n=1 Tax=Rhizophora mucronata TaxID=61149 RepID=A0A2P2K3F2_RHIMU